MKKPIKKLGLPALCLSLPLAYSSAYAAVISVTAGAVDQTNNGSCSLIEAVISATVDNNNHEPACVAGDNASNGGDIIELPENSQFVISNPASNFIALPQIASKITINGNGSVISRSTQKGPDAFRLISVGNGGDLTLNRVTLENGRYASILLSNNTFIGGSAIQNFGQLKLVDSTLKNNTTTDGFRPFAAGGAIHNQGQLELIRSTLNSNRIEGTRSALGAAIYQDQPAATLTISQSTLSNNQAAITGNQPGQATHGLHIQAGSVNILQSTLIGTSPQILSRNNVALNNSLVSGCTPDLSVTNNGSISADTSCGDSQTRNLQLSALGKFGGNTATHALLQNSPAISSTPRNCAINPQTNQPFTQDQRGQSRDASCDTGSFERVDADHPMLAALSNNNQELFRVTSIDSGNRIRLVPVTEGSAFADIPAYNNTMSWLNSQGQVENTRLTWRDPLGRYYFTYPGNFGNLPQVGDYLVHTKRTLTPEQATQLSSGNNAQLHTVSRINPNGQLYLQGVNLAQLPGNVQVRWFDDEGNIITGTLGWRAPNGAYAYLNVPTGAQPPLRNGQVAVVTP